MDSSKLHILTVGLDESSMKLARGIFKDSKVTDVPAMPDFEKMLDAPPPGPFHTILCGTQIVGLSVQELAQTLRTMFSGSPIFYLTRNREGYERKVYIKNGFDDSFLLPLDESTFQRKILEVLSLLKDANVQVFKSVKITDMEADSKLDFDVSIFMPANKKYVKLINSGDGMDKSQIEKFQKHNVSNLYVPLAQMPKFYKYSADKLTALGKPSGTLSETERKEKLHSAVRDIFSSVFNSDAKVATIGDGKSIVSDCEGIVKSFITNSDPGEWYQKLQSSIESETTDTYSHHSNVSTFAALFSIGLQMGNPSDLAVAGLFHDIGLTDVPQEVLNKPESEWSPEEKQLYQMHPEISLKIMKERKLIVPASVSNAVLQHHERFNGTGFPKAMQGAKICLEAQILALADQFDYLTAFKIGQKALTPLEAIRQMQNAGGFNPELLKKVIDILPKV